MNKLNAFNLSWATAAEGINNLIASLLLGQQVATKIAGKLCLRLPTTTAFLRLPLPSSLPTLSANPPVIARQAAVMLGFALAPLLSYLSLWTLLAKLAG